MEGPVNYGYRDSLSNHSSPDHFTGCVVQGTLNIHECSNSESFKVQLVLNQIHCFSQDCFGRATSPVGMLIPVQRFCLQDLIADVSVHESLHRFKYEGGKADCSEILRGCPSVLACFRYKNDPCSSSSFQKVTQTQTGPSKSYQRPSDEVHSPLQEDRVNSVQTWQLERVKALQGPSNPGWGGDLIGQPRSYSQLGRGQRSVLLRILPPTSVGPLKSGNCATVRRVSVSSSDSEYVPSDSHRVVDIAPRWRASSLFSPAASAHISMSEQKRIQLLSLTSLISILHASLVALDKFHSSFVLPFLAHLNLSLVSLQSISSFTFHQWISRAFLIFEGKQLCSFAVMMADENWSAALSRISASLISMVVPWSAGCRSVEQHSQFVFLGFLVHVGQEGACDSSSYSICMQSDREDSSENLHYLTLSRILPVQRVMSITSSRTKFRKVGIVPVFTISKSVVIRQSTRSSPLLLVSVLPQSL